MGRVWFRERPACPPAVSGSSVRCGCVCWARVSAVPSPSWLGCRGVFFAFFFSFFFFFFLSIFWVFLSRALWSLSPHLLSFGLGWWLSLFFFLFWCPFHAGPLFLAWCCWFLVGGPPESLWGSCLRCLLGGGFGRLWWCWRAVWQLWAVFAPFPPPPSVFFLLGGGGLACSSLCLPWAGARTGLQSVLSSGLLFSVAFCLAAFGPNGSGGPCTRWARRPFLPG